MARRSGFSSILATNAATKRLATNCDRCKPQSHEDTMRYLKTSPLSLARAQPYQHNAPPGGGGLLRGPSLTAVPARKSSGCWRKRRSRRPKRGRNVAEMWYLSGGPDYVCWPCRAGRSHSGCRSSRQSTTPNAPPRTQNVPPRTQNSPSQTKSAPPQSKNAPPPTHIGGRTEEAHSIGAGFPPNLYVG